MDRFTDQQIDTIEEQLRQEPDRDEENQSGWGEQGVKHENE